MVGLRNSMKTPDEPQVRELLNPANGIVTAIRRTEHDARSQNSMLTHLTRDAELVGKAVTGKCDRLK